MIANRGDSPIRRQEASQIGLRPAERKGNSMSFGLYSIGFAILIGGLIYGAVLVHIPGHWIAVGAIVLIGFGILKGVKATRQRDPMA
jgi:hypothetical protein